MIPEDEAYETLCRRLTADTADPIARAAWRVLDAALRADGDLPLPWERLSAQAAADRAGKDRRQWSSLVTQGYGPKADGVDSASRAYWHPSTIDAWRKPNKGDDE